VRTRGKNADVREVDVTIDRVEPHAIEEPTASGEGVVEGVPDDLFVGAVEVVALDSVKRLEGHGESDVQLATDGIHRDVVEPLSAVVDYGDEIAAVQIRALGQPGPPVVPVEMLRQQVDVDAPWTTARPEIDQSHEVGPVAVEPLHDARPSGHRAGRPACRNVEADGIRTRSAGTQSGHHGRENCEKFPRSAHRISSCPTTEGEEPCSSPRDSSNTGSEHGTSRRSRLKKDWAADPSPCLHGIMASIGPQEERRTTRRFVARGSATLCAL
jgi:hypothetical protein